MLIAGEDMDLRPVDQRLVRSAEYFLQVAFGLFELVLLQCAQARFVALHRLGVTWVLGHLLLGGYFQWHQTAFSSELKSKLRISNAHCLRTFNRRGPTCVKKNFFAFPL